MTDMLPPEEIHAVKSRSPEKNAMHTPDMGSLEPYQQDLEMVSHSPDVTDVTPDVKDVKVNWAAGESHFEDDFRITPQVTPQPMTKSTSVGSVPSNCSEWDEQDSETSEEARELTTGNHPSCTLGTCCHWLCTLGTCCQFWFPSIFFATSVMILFGFAMKLFLNGHTNNGNLSFVWIFIFLVAWFGLGTKYHRFDVTPRHAILLLESWLKHDDRNGRWEPPTNSNDEIILLDENLKKTEKALKISHIGGSLDLTQKEHVRAAIHYIWSSYMPGFQVGSTVSVNLEDKWKEGEITRIVKRGRMFSIKVNGEDKKFPLNKVISQQSFKLEKGLCGLKWLWRGCGPYISIYFQSYNTSKQKSSRPSWTQLWEEGCCRCTSYCCRESFCAILFVCWIVIWPVCIATFIYTVESRPADLHKEAFRMHNITRYSETMAQCNMTGYSNFTASANDCSAFDDSLEETTMVQSGLDFIYSIPDLDIPSQTRTMILILFPILWIARIVSRCDAVFGRRKDLAQCCEKVFDSCHCYDKFSGILAVYTALAVMPPLLYYFWNYGWVSAAFVLLCILPLIGIMVYGCCIVPDPIYRLQEIKRLKDNQTSQKERARLLRYVPLINWEKTSEHFYLFDNDENYRKFQSWANDERESQSPMVLRTLTLARKRQQSQVMSTYVRRRSQSNDSNLHIESLSKTNDDPVESYSHTASRNSQIMSFACYVLFFFMQLSILLRTIERLLQLQCSDPEVFLCEICLVERDISCNDTFANYCTANAAECVPLISNNNAACGDLFWKTVGAFLAFAAVLTLGTFFLRPVGTIDKRKGMKCSLEFKFLLIVVAVFLIFLTISITSYFEEYDKLDSECMYYYLLSVCIISGGSVVCALYLLITGYFDPKIKEKLLLSWKRGSLVWFRPKDDELWAKKKNCCSICGYCQYKMLSYAWKKGIVLDSTLSKDNNSGEIMIQPLKDELEDKEAPAPSHELIVDDYTATHGTRNGQVCIKQFHNIILSNRIHALMAVLSTLSLVMLIFWWWTPKLPFYYYEKEIVYMELGFASIFLLLMGYNLRNGLKINLFLVRIYKILVEDLLAFWIALVIWIPTIGFYRGVFMNIWSVKFADVDKSAEPKNERKLHFWGFPSFHKEVCKIIRQLLIMIACIYFCFYKLFSICSLSYTSGRCKFYCCNPYLVYKECERHLSIFFLDGKRIGDALDLSTSVISVARSKTVRKWLQFILPLVTAIQIGTQMAHNLDPEENMDDAVSITINCLWPIFWGLFGICGFYVLNTFDSLKKGHIRRLEMGQYESEKEAIKEIYVKASAKFLDLDELWTVILLRLAVTSWIICFSILIHDYTFIANEEFRLTLIDAEVINSYVTYLLLTPVHFLCWAPAWMVLSDSLRSHCMFLNHVLPEEPEDATSWAKVRRGNGNSIDWGVNNPEDDLSGMEEHNSLEDPQKSVFLHSMDDFSDFNERWYILHSLIMKFNELMKTYILMIFGMIIFAVILGLAQLTVVLLGIGWYHDKQQYAYSAMNVGLWGTFALMTVVLKLQLIDETAENGLKTLKEKVAEQATKGKLKKHSARILQGFDIAIEALTESHPIVVQVGYLSVKGLQYQLAKVFTSAAVFGWFLRMLFLIIKEGEISFNP